MDKKEQDLDFELDDELDGQPTSIQHILTIGVIFLAACGFIALSWYAYNSYNFHQPEKVPTLQADVSPTKVSPQDPGGMKIPNMDKQVYGRFSKKASTPNVERILPGPEEPVDKNRVIHELQKQESSNIPEDDSNEQAVSSSNELKATQEIPVVAAVKAPEAQKALEKLAKTRQEKTIVPTEKTVTTRDIVTNLPKGSRFSKSDYKDQGASKLYRVQIASFKTEKDAKDSLKKRFSTSATPLFASYKFFIEKKNIPGKGLVYRLQIGELDNEADAQELCKKLKNSSIDCFTVRP